LNGSKPPEAGISKRIILTMAEQQNIQWKRLTVEAAAIVGSILLAFAIDAWWADRQDRAEEQRIFLGLKSEFEQNLGLIEIELSYRVAVIDSILKIFDVSVTPSSLEPEVLDELIGDVTWWKKIEYSRGAIDGLLQSGRLLLIENEDLRRVLASMPSRYDFTSRAELNDWYTTVNVVIPYLNTHASLSQIANTMAKGRPGTGAGQTPPLYPASDLQDHTGLLRDPEFLGILVQEHWNHLEAIPAYESLRAALENGVLLIDLELNN
jgi:hypothetical protein